MSLTRHYSPLQGLPTEILLHILAFLDLTSLCRVACVNRKLKTLAYDKSLYTKLDLFWIKSDSDSKLIRKLWKACPLVRKALARRYQSLHKLDFLYLDPRVEAKLEEFLEAADCRITHLQAFATIRLPDWSELVDVSLQTSFRAGEHWTPLLQCHRLVRLHLLNNNTCTEQMVAVLRQNLSLKYLSIQHCYKLQNLEHLTRSLAMYNGALETLKFGNGEISCEMIDHIAKLRHLKELELEDFRGNDAKYGDNLLNLFTSCKLLRKLSLIFCPQVTAREINGLVKRCPRITHLRLHKCWNAGIDYELGQHVLSSLRSLEYLSTDCMCMTVEEFDKLRLAYPRVRIT